MSYDFLSDYYRYTEQRLASGLPSRFLSCIEVEKVIEACLTVQKKFGHDLKKLLERHVAAHDVDSLQRKAHFLHQIAIGQLKSELFTPHEAIKSLGAMQGKGNSADYLVQLLENTSVAKYAFIQLTTCIFLFHTYYLVVKYASYNPWAKKLLQYWAKASWLHQRPSLSHTINAGVFKIVGSTDLIQLFSKQVTWQRADTPLYAQSLLQEIIPNALQCITELKATYSNVAFVFDDLSTNSVTPSARYFALQALLWCVGKVRSDQFDKAHHGILMTPSRQQDPFYTLAENSSTLVLEVDTKKIATGDRITLFPYQNYMITPLQHKVIFKASENFTQIWQAGGRQQFEIGSALTQRALQDLQNLQSKKACKFHDTTRLHYTLAQKIVGKACGTTPVLPGIDCTAKIETIDTRNIEFLPEYEFKTLPTLGTAVAFSVGEYGFLKASIEKKGHIFLKPGDGMWEIWLNFMLLPDTLGVSVQNNSSFALGMGLKQSSLTAIKTRLTGFISFKMPESVCIRFYGRLQPGITIKDLTHAIAYVARQKSIISTHHNIFQGRILEIVGLSHISVEDAHEFIEFSQRLSVFACVVQLSLKTVKSHIQNSISLLKHMLESDYQDAQSLERRLEKMQAWSERDVLLQGDEKAHYIKTVYICLNDVREPLIANFDNVLDIKPLSTMKQKAIHEVFFNPTLDFNSYYMLGKYLSTVKSVKIPVWVTPSTKFLVKALQAKEYYRIYSDKKVYTQMPDHRLCFGKEVQLDAYILTNTKRYFTNHQKKIAQGYVASTQLGAIVGVLGRFPSHLEYQKILSSWPLTSTNTSPIN